MSTPTETQKAAAAAAAAEHQLHHHHAAPEQVVIHSYPPLLFIWPLILLGFLFNFSGALISPQAEAWTYIITLVTVLLTIGVDMNRNVTIFWLVLVFGFWFAAMWLRDVKGFMGLENLIKYIGDLNPQWSKPFGFVLSLTLSVFYIIMIIKAWLNDRWRFINNEIEHKSFGMTDSAMGRGAKRISTSYPDSLEFLLLMAGTITIYSAQGRTVLANIPRVPFLPFRAARISKILESVAVTQSSMDDEAVIEQSEDVTDTHGIQ